MIHSPNSQSMEQFATKVVEKLRTAGFIGYFAGGCVRDRLLGKEPKDFDVATSALPNQVRELFGHRRTLAIGASFGVITVLGPKPLQVEVATFRNDGEYSDGRHPDGVTFSTAEEDAARRDFTINGMFFDPLANEVIDFVDGEADLQSRLIRAIGAPLERIEEDRLRMLRAVRFAATYDFQIEPETMAAVQSQAANLSAVSQERITAELQRMVTHPNRTHALRLLHESRLLPYVIAPLADVAESKPDRWRRLLRILDSNAVTGFVPTLSAMLGREGADLDIDEVAKLCRQLKLSNEERKSVAWLSKHRKQLELAPQLKYSELQPLLIHPDCRNALSLMRAVAEVDSSPTAAIEHCQRLLAQTAEKLDPPVLLRGGDLMSEGMKPGPQFAKLLDALRVAQLDGLVCTKAEALAFVKGECK